MTTKSLSRFISIGTKVGLMERNYVLSWMMHLEKSWLEENLTTLYYTTK